MHKALRKLIKRASVTSLIFAPTLTDLRCSITAIYRRLLRHPLEPGFLAIKLLGLSDRRMLIDIGGAMGESVAALRLYAKAAPILSFEPNPVFAARIEQRFAKDGNVQVKCLAVSNQAGSFPLYIPVYRYTAFPELATLEKKEAANWLPSRVFGFRPSLQTVVEITCTTCRLDSLGLDPELIKIDTRCDASAVLEGSLQTITVSRPLILLGSARLSSACEVNLRALNYVALAVKNGALYHPAKGMPCDVLVHDSTLIKIEQSSGKIKSQLSPSL